MTGIIPQQVGIIMLAAGFSKRFGADKRQAIMPDGKTVLQNTIESVPDSLVLRMLVLHAGDEEHFSNYRDRWQVFIAPRAEQGLGASLASAATELGDDWQAAIIALADMPFIQPATYQAIQQELCQSSIVAPFFNGKRGNPVGFNREFFPDIAALNGDTGAKNLLEKHADVIRHLPVTDSGILRDVDIPDALHSGHQD